MMAFGVFILARVSRNCFLQALTTISSGRKPGIPKVTPLYQQSILNKAPAVLVTLGISRFEPLLILNHIQVGNLIAAGHG